MKEFLLTMHGRNVVIRPCREGEQPHHTPHRILIGRTVHVIKGCDAHVCALKLVYEPEKKWRKCPNCDQKDWAVWIPVPIQNRERGEDEDSLPYWTQLQWYITCAHCASIIDQIYDYEIYAGEPTEYIYDPADDMDFSTFSSTHRHSSHPKRKTRMYC